MRGTPFLLEAFTGGLNTVADPYSVAPNETRECLNVVSTQRGSIKKRFGSTQLITAVPNVELLSLAAVIASGTNYLIASGAKNLYSVNSAGEISTIGEGFTEGKRWSVLQAPESKEVASEGPVYLTNGTDKTQYWTGAEKATKVKEWTGLSANLKAADGVIKQLVTRRYSSATGAFTASDLQRSITGEKIKAGTTIEAIVSPTEITLSQEAEAEGSALKYEVVRQTYEKAPNVPQGKYMVFAGNRIWMTGIEGDTSAVWFSELVPIGEGGSKGDPSFWPRTNVVRFDSSDNQPITGIGTVGPYVIVFKEYKTWVIHDLNTGANRKLADKLGCVAHRSIVETTQGTFFLTADQGVYLTDGSKLHEMSYNVRPTILKINHSKREQAAGEYWNNHYYLSYPSGESATNNRTLDYDAQLKSWWLHDLAGAQWARFSPAAGEPFLYLIPGGTKKGIAKAFVEGTYTDLGANYAGNGVLGAYWLAAWDPFAYYIFRHRIKAPFLKKRVRQIFFNGEGQIIPGVYKNFAAGERQEPAVVGNLEQATRDKLPVEFAAGTEKWGEGSGVWGTEVAGTEVIWGGETTVGQARIYAPGVGAVWAVGFGNNSAEGFLVNNFVYMISFRKS